MFPLYKVSLPGLVLGLFSLSTIASPAEVSRPTNKSTIQTAARPAITPEQREQIRQRVLAQVEQWKQKNSQLTGRAKSAGVPKASSLLMRTIAGQLAHPGGTLPSQTQLAQPGGVVVDNSGNAYVADAALCLILKVSPAGKVTVLEGNGSDGYSGDGGQAAQAESGYITGMALDGLGNLYFADNTNSVVREINLSSGIISRAVGTPHIYGSTGDGGPATSATVGSVFQLAFDSSHNLYISDGQGQVREVLASSGNITTVAGLNNGQNEGCANDIDGYGDGCPAINAYVYPLGIAVSGNTLYIGSGLNVIQAVNLTTGIINIFAGQIGQAGYSGDGGPALSAMVDQPGSIVLDTAGNLYFSDGGTYVIRKIDTSLNISTVAGNGTFGFGGDGGPAANSVLAVEGQSQISLVGTTMVIGDTGNNRIREIANVGSGGTITTVAGNGYGNYYGNGSVATKAGLLNPGQTFEDANGNLFIADQSNYAIRRVDAVTGIITTVAGTGLSTATGGDGGLATEAAVEPLQMVLDSAGNIYEVDGLTGLIRKITASTGIISTVPTSGFQFDTTGNMALDSAGANVYVAAGNQVEEVNLSTGAVTIIANVNNTQGYSGDGGLATAAELYFPTGVALDGFGNLYVADAQNYVIRVINLSSGIINTYAGTGTVGYSGDGGPALSASINYVYGLATDAAGNVYVADTQNSAVREITASNQVINTIVGNGTQGYTGNNLPPLSTELSPDNVLIDKSGNLLISDFGNELVWFLTNVPQPITNTLTSSATNVPPGSSVTLTATLTGANFFGQYPTGSVAFKSGGTTLTTVALKNGVATLTASSSGLPVGTYSITAVYGGDGTYAATNSAPLTLTVKYGSSTTVTASPTTVVAGGTVTLSGSVKPATGSGTPTGKITFYANSTAIGSSPLTSGATSLSLSTAGFPAGIYNITGVYSGDGNYATSTSSAVSVTVTAAVSATTTTLTLNPSTVAVGGSTTLKAVVAKTSGSGTPSGTVTFSASGRTLTTVSLSGGVASFTASTSGYPIGSYTITAKYNGDSTDNTSTSSAVTLKIEAASKTVLAVSPNPVTSGASITLTATVTPASGSGTPAGTVSFIANGSTLTSATLNGSGVATITVPTTGYAKGSYSLKATYNGGSTYAPSTSSTVTLVIQ
jgi:sugar lactone lactonase YvrE